MEGSLFCLSFLGGVGKVKVPGEITLLDADSMRRALSRIAYEIVERISDLDRLVLCGIHTRGSILADRLAKKIEELEGCSIPYFAIDISRYRDDRLLVDEQMGIRQHNASLGHEFVPMIEAKSIVLVDDVLFTGRTVRAALDALTSTARPDLIQLAVLIDRGHRELPIRPDYVGKNIPTARAERVQVLVNEIDLHDGVYLKK